MCVALSGKITQINQQTNQAIVDFGGVKKTVSLFLLKKVTLGDYVLVHAGFAIQKVDHQTAQDIKKAIHNN